MEEDCHGHDHDHVHGHEEGFEDNEMTVSKINQSPSW